MTSSGPVVVIYKAKGCPFCTILDKMMPEIKAALVSVDHTVRVEEINSPGLSGEYDITKYPQSIKRLGGYFPITMYIPGAVWNAATVNPELLLTIEDGIIIKGGNWSPELQRAVNDPNSEYQANTAEVFKKWFQMCLAANKDLTKPPEGLLVYNVKRDDGFYNIVSPGTNRNRIEFAG